MASVAIQPVGGAVPERQMPYVRAQLPSRRRIDLSVAPVDVHFHVRVVGKEDVVVLADDPTIARPLALLRLFGNAAATFVLVLILGLAVAATAPRLFGYGSTVVTSGSMRPAIRLADVVIISSSDGVGLNEGAVINFENNDGMRLHRITSVTEDGGYRTTGDANRVADSEIVYPEQVRGIGIVVVPFIGLAATWIETGRWLYVALTALCLAIAMYISRARFVEGGSDPLGLRSR